MIDYFREFVRDMAREFPLWFVLAVWAVGAVTGIALNC